MTKDSLVFSFFLLFQSILFLRGILCVSRRKENWGEEEAVVTFVKSSCHNLMCRLEVSLMNECAPFSCICIVPVTLEVSQH